MAYSRWQAAVCALTMSLFLAGCMEAATPSPTSTPAISLPEKTVQASVTSAPPATQPSTPTRLAQATAGTTPAVQASTTAVPGSSPSYSQGLNLGIAYGNTYEVQAIAIDRPHGLLYALGRRDGDRTSQGQISVVNLASGQVTSTFPLSLTVGFQSKMSMSVDGRSLFIQNGSDVRSALMAVVDLSPARPQIMQTHGAVSAIAFDAVAGQVYLLESVVLRKLDAATLQVTASVPVRDVQPMPQSLLAVNHAAGRLYLARPDSTISVYDANDLSAVGDVKMDGRVTYLAAHPTRPETYAVVESMAGGSVAYTIVVLQDNVIKARWDAGPGFSTGNIVFSEGGDLLVLQDARDLPNGGSRIITLNAATGEQITSLALPYMSLAYAGLTDVHQRTLYLMTDRLLSIDLVDGHSAPPIHLGVNLIASTLDTANDRLYVMDSMGAIHVIHTDPAPQQTALWPRVIDPGLSGLWSGEMSVAGGRLYVKDQRANVTRVLDAVTGKELATIAKAGGVTADLARHRLYLTSQGVYTLDSETLAITGAISETLRQSQMVVPGALSATYDPNLDLLFVTMTNNSPGSSNSSWLQIYDGATLARVRPAVKTDQQFLSGLATDAATGKIWVSSGYPGHSLTAFDRDGRAVIRLQGVGSGLFLDGERKRLYANDWGGIVTLDNENGALLGFRTSPPYAPGLLAYDVKHHRFYINSMESAVLSAFDPADPVIATRSVVPTLFRNKVDTLCGDGGPGTIAAISSSDTGRYQLVQSSAAGWMSIDSGLPQQMMPQLVCSPGSPSIIFAYGASMVGAGFFRSADGGQTWQVPARGLTDFRVAGMALSPAFSRDGTGVLRTSDGSVYETRDSGQSWVRIPDVAGTFIAMSAGPGASPRFLVIGPDMKTYTQTLISSGTSERSTSRVVDLGVSAYRFSSLGLSPQGETALLYARSEASSAQSPAGFLLLQESGATWRFIPVGLEPELPVSRIVFSPAFSTDHTIYALLMPFFVRPQDQSVLLRSTDGGLSWASATNASLLVSALAVAPTGQLLVGTTQGEITVVDPSSLIWQRLPPVPPAPVATPLATPAPIPSPVSPPLPTATPSSPPAGVYQPDPAFDRVWANQDVRDTLGWATESQARQVWVAIQPFELSQYMIWREDNHTITVLEGTGQWSVYDDTWADGQPEQDPGIVAPPGKFQPKRGFGKLWRTVAGLRDQLGWALEPEKGYTAAVQSFQHGAIIKIDDAVYVLGKSGDSTVWQRR